MHDSAQPICPIQSLAQYLSHLHELLEGFKLEELAFCYQLLRITLLQKTEKRTVHLGDGEGIQTDLHKDSLFPGKIPVVALNTIT